MGLPKKLKVQKPISELQLSGRRLPRGIKWLMFLDTLLSVEEAFNKTYIPFDSEFVVAQGSTGSSDGNLRVVLTELYHVHVSFPLQKFRIGVWSPATGLTWANAPFAQRRTDLRGIVIKGALRPQVIFWSSSLIPVSRNKSYEV
jgi:hypothetical protein